MATVNGSQLYIVSEAQRAALVNAPKGADSCLTDCDELEKVLRTTEQPGLRTDFYVTRSD